MASDGIPTTSKVRAGYRFGHNDMTTRDFDAWLNKHDAEVAAKALRDAADRMKNPASGAPYEVWASGAGGWLRTEAGRIKDDPNGA